MARGHFGRQLRQFREHSGHPRNPRLKKVLSKNARLAPELLQRQKICNRTLQAATICNVSQSQDDLYQQATAAYGNALDRLVQAYEIDSERREDLLQEIHLALWRSFERFEARCSLRTWVYRVAHNIATSHVIRQRRANMYLLRSLEEIDSMPDQGTHLREAHNRMDLERLLQLIHQLNPPDREIAAALD